MLSRVTIMAHGQTVVIRGNDPSFWAEADQARVGFPQGDGLIVSSTIRTIAKQGEVNSIQWGDFGVVVFKKGP